MASDSCHKDATGRHWLLPALTSGSVKLNSSAGTTRPEGAATLVQFITAFGRPRVLTSCSAESRRKRYIVADRSPAPLPSRHRCQWRLARRIAPAKSVGEKAGTKPIKIDGPGRLDT
jgi:hypothetical protein